MGRNLPKAWALEFRPIGNPGQGGAGELGSPPFQADGDVSEQLSATIGGKPVVVTISIR